MGELGAIIETVFRGEEVGGSDKVLDSGNDRFAVSRRAEVVFHAHELYGLRASFFGLWDVQVHFVAVEIGVIGITDTFIEAEGLPWADFSIVA